jgi:autotransporter strand-loop-strand O-heptosyltransferase
MKIVQVTPGNIPIPPNGWGAVEKIIWEYKLCLEKNGWKTEIKYADEVKNEPDQIVHVHFANLANFLFERGIPYVFSLHDHHVEYWGKNSTAYSENYIAIKNSKLTFVHSTHLIEYFDNLPQIVYLSHGVNLNDYKFSDRSNEIRQNKIKLLMMANNGIGGDLLKDRKGFLIGVESAKILDLPIDIMCPSSNKSFFDHWKVNYDKLNILYDVDYQDSIKKMEDYNIFLHPSNLEAGHPNLTILESISMGIPVIGTCNQNLPGMVTCRPETELLVENIRIALQKYDSLVSQIQYERINLSWDLVVSRMIQYYKKFFDITEKQQLIQSYNSTKISETGHRDISGIITNFSERRAFCKISFSGDYVVTFKDCRTNRIIFHGLTQKSTNMWFTSYKKNKFIDWSIQVKEGANIIYSENLSLKNKKVLLINQNHRLDHNLIEKFISETGCLLTIKSEIGYYIPGVQVDPRANESSFYYSLDEIQMLDYFLPEQQLEENILIVVNTSALGDKIVAISYAQRWAQKHNMFVYLHVNGSDIFDPKDYPNLIIKNGLDFEASEFSDIIYLDYKFDRPLQRGFSDQLGLEYEEIRPVVKKSTKPKIIRNKYVCFGVHSSSQCKYWNYPDGWEILSKEFRKMNITPVCVDLHEIFGIEGWWNFLPKSSVKKVGLPFDEVINIIQNSEFFIGVSSGLSWVAHALGKKVVLISGTTPEDNEFTIDILRIQNKEVCNSCFTKTSNWKFNGSDWTWCPEHSGSTKWFECTRTITPNSIIEELKKNKWI